MLILGIDPGTATTGYGIIKAESKIFEIIDFGLIETEKNGDPGKRLINIHNQMKRILIDFNPDVVAIERLFFATNAKTAMRVGQAHGVLLYCAASQKKQVFEYAPGTIKKLITGDGRADKKMMQKSIRKVFGPAVRSRPKKRTHFDNAADALAVALTHALRINEKVGDH
ncbi:MAG: Crossover junction endodeoxyribonuclease RuvC [Microgenomates group bacterium GW2011_GWC1_37_8]|uniref:Crossover junction endodeoxyribonuclease RuvC n=1 Tax=Candidatus Woesebacteria bacterium GW2011_GWB1_38_8 TaxID=1618570 RepID=A0A0G0NHB5_9BACT|nr:MAG: Crossover junction endodeoxyribonuclease RuvC [Microgenomates group bacterium GW2011_GWC1_37_8]KKQ85279.1 MAG: Crossover junction endodeoxyribonuclease RuvC [Candidatus Woesebacteria bacterium GW2011_GWB1_38_8]